MTYEIPNFLTLETRPDKRGVLRAGGASLAAHVVLIAAFLAAAPGLTSIPEAQAAFRGHVTPLVAPPQQLTQRDPNRGPLSREFNVDSIRPRTEAEPRVPSPGAAPSPALTPRKFRMPDRPRPAVPSPGLADAPPIDLARGIQAPPQGLGVPTPSLPPPRIETQERPKLTLETPGTATGASSQRGIVQVPKPQSGVNEAIRQAARGGGGIIVGDDEGFSSPSGGLQPAPNGGRIGSSLELLSDPQGADMRPYLLRVLSAVRRNWYAVIPESARLGQQGRVIVQFAIGRDGSVQKIVFGLQSGTDALDRAAIAGVSASVPFPPLPAEFRGSQIRLQMTFSYNIAR
ncbi:MAG TPA: TonB family protein [Bryobacteraceae bacterium]|nr:TonB family protein [Bryobacteraceae bacterium]